MTAPTNQPPGGKNPNDLPKNPPTPTVESPPLFMSLEQVNQIADPNLRHALKISLSLQQNTINRAQADRATRIERLCKKIGRQDIRDKLIAQAQSPSCALSLSADGTVNDPMAAQLEILEGSVRDLPAMLLTTQAQLSEMPHPRDPDGAMTEERRKSVVDEFCKNAHLPDPAAAR